ncbi:MAG TPA: Vms1/Ankzf1 family peptidyl-tRNA hydrolase [Micromonosporaceae bacterium]
MNLSMLRPLYARPGPWASVYLDASYDTEDAAKARELRWQGLRQELAEAGADERTLAALDAEVATQRGVGRYGLALFASDGEVALVESLPDPPARQEAVWSRLPAVRPLLATVGEQVRWVRVLADRTGADLVAEAGGRPMRAEVEGSEEFPIRKVAPGGWSNPRYQRAAQVSWERNAVEIAEAVRVMADRTGADVVVVAGDVRERQLLMDHLPAAVRPLVVETEAGSRAAGAATEPLDEAVDRAVASRIDERRAEVRDRFLRGFAHGLATAGRDRVLGALRRSQVDTLLMAAPGGADGTPVPGTDGVDGTVWMDPGDTSKVAANHAELESLGVDRSEPVPAAEALIAAAAATDADLVVFDPQELDMDDGVGAVLRYSLPASATEGAPG